jgi:hypothetical protein
MSRFLHAAMLGALVVAPITIAPTALLAEHVTYRDAHHNDKHRWNATEQKAYRIWVNEYHRQYHEFAKILPADQQAYWDWRHEHPNAMLGLETH